jgi:Uma2 family endonuclease
MGTQPRAPTPRMTVEEFLASAEGRPGRHELVRGEVVAQAAEQAAHYLIIDPDEMLVIHHQRHGEDILTRILRDGAIALDPPGIEVAVGEIYGGGGYSPAST